jgi:hypothetical protein
MSATNRSEVRHPDDFYATPAWATRAILAQFVVRAGDTALEPCCGDGAIVRELINVGFHPGRVTAIDIDAGRVAETARMVGDVAVEDWLLTDGEASYDLVITNPPFRLAMEFVTKSLKHVGDSGTVAMLLRLNWLASAGRREFHKAHPSDVYVLPKRPEFAASLKCAAKPRCGWEVQQALDAGRPSTCPGCGAKVTCSTTDSCEYAWFVWGPGRGNRWWVL